MKLNLKKLFTLIFVLLLCFTMTTLTSCNEENDDPSNSPSGEVTSWKDSVVFESDSFVYDGEAKKIEVKNAPEGAKVSYRNNNKKDPGEYKVTATIEYNGEFLYLNAVLTINSLSSTLSAEANQIVVFYGGTVLPEFELDNDVQTVGYIVYDKEGNELTLEDVLGTESDIVTRPLEENNMKKIMLEEISKLKPRDKEIMIRRYGLDGKDELTQKEVAAYLGISQSYISRIEKKVIKEISEIIRI